mmetsp:Transcript_86977/g.174005  ORF Transcript_86977/g.174005 Transcript_86977/m.174005 type:complete len:158 (+) Transcript_86977:91-564(+)
MAFGLSFILAPWTQLLIMFWAPYQSFKAVISEDPSDDTQWLTFWSVYSVFTFFEEFGLRYVITCFTFFGQSFYYEIKAAIIVWLMFFNGAEFIFKTFVKPFMAEYQKTIDDAVKKASDMAEEKKNEALSDPDGFINTHGKETYDVIMKQKAMLTKSE